MLLTSILIKSQDFPAAYNHKQLNTFEINILLIRNFIKKSVNDVVVDSNTRSVERTTL